MNVNIRFRNIVYLITLVLFAWLIIRIKDILSPFIIAMIFAYVFNPLTNFFSAKFRLHRVVSIVLVYVILIGSAAFLITSLTRSVISESESIKHTFEGFNGSFGKVSNAPDWLKLIFADYFDTFSKTQIPTTISFPVFTKAFSSIISFFVFLFAAFFFLKDGRKIPRKIVELTPVEYRKQSQELIARINAVLSRYLRGQIILVAVMVVMLFAALTVLGVKNALTLSFMFALFEIVPIIGPIVASVFGTFLIIISGGAANFPMTIPMTIIVILLIFFASRYIQDYVFQPLVIGKATDLHPLLILFSVLAGERLFGILGIIIAVPVSASIKILYQFLFEQINKEAKTTK